MILMPSNAKAFAHGFLIDRLGLPHSILDDREVSLEFIEINSADLFFFKPAARREFVVWKAWFWQSKNKLHNLIITDHLNMNKENRSHNFTPAFSPKVVPIQDSAPA